MYKPPKPQTLDPKPQTLSPDNQALAGKESPSADDIKAILESVESEYVAALRTGDSNNSIIIVV